MALLSNECHMTKHIQDTKLFAKICYNKIIHNTNLFAKVFNLEVLCRFLSDTSAKIELIHLERIFEMLRRLIESCDGISFLFHVQRPLSLLTIYWERDWNTACMNLFNLFFPTSALTLSWRMILTLISLTLGKIEVFVCLVFLVCLSLTKMWTKTYFHNSALCLSLTIWF